MSGTGAPWPPCSPPERLRAPSRPGEEPAVIDIRAEAHIRCPAETIFDVIIDFRGQEQWLPRSSAFRGTTEISSDPVTLGTTYHEPGPFGARNGIVTEFDRPARVTFHQPMAIRLHGGTVDVTLRYLLVPGTGATHVSRTVTLGIPRQLTPLRSVIVRQFRLESARTLQMRKQNTETLPAIPG
jgi:uncharacterized protein YndB with AHSA1/START domain